MRNLTVVLTETDRLILESYKHTADAIADFWQDSCEIVIHSLERLDCSIIKIVNGQHSGRGVGSPITDATLAILNRMLDDPSLRHVTYFTQNARGEHVKASTSAIYGENYRIIGLFCINFFLSTPFSSFLHVLTPSNTQSLKAHLRENFADNTEDLMLSALDEVKKMVYDDPTVSPSNKNKEIIYLLYQKGIFNLKDSVITIATHLGISKNTVYMHIRNIPK